MSTEAYPKGKGGKAPATASNDADSLVPLLLATIGNPAISFKKMAAMDELGRTESSIEHKFRKWRQKGREIAAQNPAHTGSLGTSSAGAAVTKKPCVPAKKGANDGGKGLIKQDGIGIEELGTDEMGGIEGETLHPSARGESAATNSTKKRAASLQAARTEQEAGDVPTKKAKVAKKGTARVVKKHKRKVYSSSEEEDTESEDEKGVPTKPKVKGKSIEAAASSNANAAANRSEPAKAKKEKAAQAARAAKAGKIHSHEGEDADFDMHSEDSRHKDMVEMQFDRAA